MPTITPKIKQNLVNTLLACPVLQTSRGRDDVIAHLPEMIRHGISRRDDARSDVTNLLERSLNYPNGLSGLLDALHYYEGDSLPFMEVQHQAERLIRDQQQLIAITSSGLPVPTISRSRDAITPTSPLLIGIVVDVSRSVLDLLLHLPKEERIPRTKLEETVNLMVEKALAYCRTPEAEDVLPRFALFAYGFGFGKIRRAVASIFSRMGIQSGQMFQDELPVEPVRDLFAEIAAREGMPLTPDASELNRYWDVYQRSIEAQFLDAGAGESTLYMALQTVHGRFLQELPGHYFASPILLIISDGQMENANDPAIFDTVAKIQQLGVEIACGYLGSKTVTQAHHLYAQSEANWPENARRIFHCASPLSGRNQVTTAILEMVAEKGWQVDPEARLFLQINHREMLVELIELLLSPLRD
jgi:hypothetical protein